MMSPPSASIDPTLRIGAVRLAVEELSRSVEFYEHVLGLALIRRDEPAAALGPDRARPALLLASVTGAVTAPAHSTGLFHVAWLHPSREALAQTVRRIAGAGWPIDGASDHGVSEALYLRDPDGLGIEIYADRPRERWRRPEDGRGVVMVTLPLDVDDLLAQADADDTPAASQDIRVGHVHLKVSDVQRALVFYRDVLGFEVQAQLPGAAFLAAGGYHHHLGLNSWHSRGASAPPAHAPGLREVQFELAEMQPLAELEQRLERAHVPFASDEESRRLSLGDPDGNRLTFALAAAAPPSSPRAGTSGSGRGGLVQARELGS